MRPEAGDEPVQAVTPEPREPRPWMTLFLMGAILLVWLIMTVQGGSLNATAENMELIVGWGAANRPDLFASGEYWRLLTANFLHFGLIHLAVNVYSLWVVGRAIETLYGPWRLLYLFLVAGVLGAAVSVLFGRPVATSAGASGAIFGLLGAVVWYRLSSPLGERVLWRPLLTTLGLNLMIGLSLHNMIDNWDHMGGLAGGLLAAAAMGVPMIPGWPRPRYYFGGWAQRVVAVLLLAATALLPAGAVSLPGPSYQLFRALTAHREGHLAEAEAGYLRAIRQQGDVPGLYGYLIAVYLQEGKCQEARTVYGTLNRLDPAYPDLPRLMPYVLACGQK